MLHGCGTCMSSVPDDPHISVGYDQPDVWGTIYKLYVKLTIGVSHSFIPSLTHPLTHSPLYAIICVQLCMYRNVLFIHILGQFWHAYICVSVLHSVELYTHDILNPATLGFIPILPMDPKLHLSCMLNYRRSTSNMIIYTWGQHLFSCQGPRHMTTYYKAFLWQMP